MVIYLKDCKLFFIVIKRGNNDKCLVYFIVEVIYLGGLNKVLKYIVFLKI